MKKIFIVFLLIVSFYFPVISVSAESLTVTATIDTTLILQGYTSPNSLVVFLENNSAKGSTISNNLGYFEKEFNNQEAGIHIIDIYSTDRNNLKTLTVSFQVLLIKNQSITVSNIYLPPTISLSQTNYSYYDKIIVSGYSKPHSLIKIEINGQTGKINYVSSDKNGFYTDQIEANKLTPGNYQIKSHLYNLLSITPTTSESLNFTILSDLTPHPTNLIVTQKYPTPFPTPTPIPCPYHFTNLCFYDKEKKGFIELEKPSFINYLIDFIKNFGKPLRKPILADLNDDKRVDVIDFSIFLFFVKAKNEKILGVSVPQQNQSVLGLESQKLDYPFTIVDNKYMPLFSHPLVNLIFNLTLTEIIIGIPLLLVFIILILFFKKNGKK